jgi:hypothetical protein
MVVACLLASPAGCSSSPFEEENALGFREVEDEHQSEAKSQGRKLGSVQGKKLGNRCGNGELNPGEECDDDSPRCSDDCTYQPCTWDIDNLQFSFPVHVRSGQDALGQITFDGDCNLLVSGGEELPYVEPIYRVDKDDGQVSVAITVADLPADTFHVPAMTYRHDDDRVYFFAGNPRQLYALDDQDQVHTVLALDKPINTLTVAPQTFGSYGGQLIALAYSPGRLLAIDVDAEEKTITEIVSAWDNPLSAAVFGEDGTLYVAEYNKGTISTVSPDGQVTPVFSGFTFPDGMARSIDGTRMFVAHRPSGGRIDEISLLDGTLISAHPFEISVGFAATGTVIDGADRVLYQELVDDQHAMIKML